MQPEYNIEEFVENNVELFNICVTALASFFACKILVFDILKNEESVIQDRELRNQNSPISFTIENQVLLCFVYKKIFFLNENGLHDLTKDQELVYNIGRPQLITPHSGHWKVYSRAHKFNSINITTHIADIYNFISQNDTTCNKTSLIIMSDSGPDLCPTSLNGINVRVFFEKKHRKKALVVSW